MGIGHFDDDNDVTKGTDTSYRLSQARSRLRPLKQLCFLQTSERWNYLG